MTFEFVRYRWLRHPEDCANCIETCWGADTVTIYVILMCMLLDNEDTLVIYFKIKGDKHFYADCCNFVRHSYKFDSYVKEEDPATNSSLC